MFQRLTPTNGRHAARTTPEDPGHRHKPDKKCPFVDATEPDVTGREIVQVTGNAGDLVLWNALLPHRGGKNTGKTPRITQYISMRPAGPPEKAAERVANAIPPAPAPKYGPRTSTRPQASENPLNAWALSPEQ